MPTSLYYLTLSCLPNVVCLTKDDDLVAIAHSLIEARFANIVAYLAAPVTELSTLLRFSLFGAHVYCF